MNTTLRTLNDEFATAVAGLDSEQTQLRPRRYAGKWSIEQVALHLTMSYDLTSAAMEKRIERGTPTRATPTPIQRFAQLLVVSAQWFPAGRKAPEPVTPPDDPAPLSGAEIAASAREKIDRLEACSQQAEALFGRERSVSHAVLGPLSVAQWRTFQLVHGRHHFKQIREIRREYGV